MADLRDFLQDFDMGGRRPAQAQAAQPQPQRRRPAASAGAPAWRGMQEFLRSQDPQRGLPGPVQGPPQRPTQGEQRAALAADWLKRNIGMPVADTVTDIPALALRAGAHLTDAASWPVSLVSPAAADFLARDAANARQTADRLALMGQQPEAPAPRVSTQSAARNTAGSGPTRAAAAAASTRARRDGPTRSSAAQTSAALQGVVAPRDVPAPLSVLDVAMMAYKDAPRGVMTDDADRWARQAAPKAPSGRDLRDMQILHLIRDLPPETKLEVLMQWEKADPLYHAIAQQFGSEYAPE